MARVTGKTGVEMEALTAASVACLTIYDMAKAVDRGMVISGIRLVEKTGGKSGDYTGRQAENGAAAGRRGAATAARRAAAVRLRRRVPLAEAAGRVLAAPLVGAPDPAALRRLGDGWLCGARRRCRARARPLKVIGIAAAGRRLCAARSAPAKPCASSPARRCRRAPTRSSSRKMRARLGGDAIEVLETVAAGRHIRRLGLDFSQGDMLLAERPRCSTPAALSLAASANHAALDVVERRWSPSSPPATNCCRRAADPGPTRSSPPTPMAWPRSPPRPARSVLDLGIVADDRDAIAGAVAQSDRAGADIIVTLGGASVGDHDLVHDVLTDAGHDARFLEDRHAARQAADVRPARRDMRCSACRATRLRAWSARTSS